MVASLIQSQVPNEFTACETYRGYVIAVRHGSYKGLLNGEPVIGAGPSATRAACRKDVDYCIRQLEAFQRRGNPLSASERAILAAA